MTGTFLVSRCKFVANEIFHFPSISSTSSPPLSPPPILVLYTHPITLNGSGSSWQTTNIQAWPLHTVPPPLYAATTIATNSFLGSSEQQQNDQTVMMRFLQLPQVMSSAQNEPQPHPYQLLYQLNSGYYAAPLLLPYVHAATASPLTTTPLKPTLAAANSLPAATTLTTTAQPQISKNAEPTTQRSVKKQSTSSLKLQATPTPFVDTRGYLQSDARLLAAVRNINPEFIIEEIVPVRGKHVLSAIGTEKLRSVYTAPAKRVHAAEFLTRTQLAPALGDLPVSPAKLQSQSSVKSPQQASMKLKKLKRPVVGANAVGPVDSEVKVESTGRTATSGNIPQIPFGTYFLPYFSQEQLSNGGKTAALILEPHSKAVVGNGGTAISTPLSRAFLKRGTPTNVYFNPESVAIAGVGGKAHAQADLELDLFDRR